jgi:archaellum component FlaG (FlaF/FlaG flagellin family)
VAKPASNSAINQDITAEDIAEAEKLVSEPIHREQVGSALVETNNMYVEDNTGKPIAPPADEWESVEEVVSVTIDGKTSTMKVTTYTDPVGGWPEEEAR